MEIIEVDVYIDDKHKEIKVNSRDISSKT